jgi:L-ascorbate metabolism protein UlaG (beta-lactamase superfamily)
VCPLGVGDVVELDGVRIEGVKAVHGPRSVRFFFGLAGKTETPGPGERVGMGAIGFKITADGKAFVNMGDTLFQEAWRDLNGPVPDVLMIPIGGRKVPNTMDEKDALKAVQLLAPKLVIPCHYNNNFMWMKNINPANDEIFKRNVENLGLACTIMEYGDEIVI